MAAVKKRKRRESWGAVRELPSRRIQASFTGPDGKRHTAPMTFSTLTDARAWLTQQRARIDSGQWVSPVAAKPGDTLGAYGADWMSTRTGRRGVALRERTRAEYARLLAGPIAPLADMKLRAITPDVVRGWYKALEDTGRHTQAARAYGLLNAILRTAVEDGLLPSNPCRIRGAQSASTGRKVEPPTAVELDLIVDAVPDRYRAMVLLAAWGGLRFGELTALTRQDAVRVQDYYLVTVSRAVVHTPGGFLVGPTKSEAGVRAVALPHHITPAIEHHLAVNVTASEDALLFPAVGGGHLAQSTLAKAFYPARAAAGRPDMPFHALRHYGATRFAQTGATLREIQARLGHSTVAAAMRYQHAAGRDAELARKMAEL